MPFHLWLRQIARDRIIDAHRRHRVSAKRSIDREQSLSAPAIHLYYFIRQLGFSIVGPAVDSRRCGDAERTRPSHRTRHPRKLNDQDAEIILMRHYEQLSNQEVALALDLTEPAASSNGADFGPRRPPPPQPCCSIPSLQLTVLRGVLMTADAFALLNNNWPGCSPS